MDALSFLQDVAGYAQAQAGNSSADRPIRLGTIDPAYAPATFWDGTLPRVRFDGEATISGKMYPVVAPYWPQPGDRVALVPVGTTYLIIGALGPGLATKWTPVTFTNGWGNFGSSWQTAQYRRDHTGRVWLRGVISGGTVGSSAFQLPAGFRPPAQFVTDAVSSGGNPPTLCRLQFNPDGTVVPQQQVGTFVALDHSFDRAP
ncbi:hypothetical protein [Actinomadura miaoliensis]|uniref:Uncharacterized protein n=1 Tax=Actinomadura miaoliensis TaxID=430685 RepID=A0ABP7W755_9ACTN